MDLEMMFSTLKKARKVVKALDLEMTLSDV